MRIKYFYTSDIEEVADKVAHQLDYFHNRKKIDNFVKNIIKLLREDKTRHAAIIEEISNVRNDLAKLDLLLQESEEILTVCHRAETGEFDNQVESQEEQKEDKPQVPPPGNNAKKEMQAALNNLADIQSTLKTMRQKND